MLRTKAFKYILDKYFEVLYVNIFFSRNVVKVFYTVGLMYDVCEVFGEVSEEVASERKYAKWKATYIHNCLKNGQTPVPGPMAGGKNSHKALSNY